MLRHGPGQRGDRLSSHPHRPGSPTRMGLVLGTPAAATNTARAGPWDTTPIPRWTASYHMGRYPRYRVPSVRPVGLSQPAPHGIKNLEAKTPPATGKITFRSRYSAFNARADDTATVTRYRHPQIDAISRTDLVGKPWHPKHLLHPKFSLLSPYLPPTPALNPVTPNPLLGTCVFCVREVGSFPPFSKRLLQNKSPADQIKSTATRPKLKQILATSRDPPPRSTPSNLENTTSVYLHEAFSYARPHRAHPRWQLLLLRPRLPPTSLSFQTLSTSLRFFKYRHKAYPAKLPPKRERVLSAPAL